MLLQACFFSHLRSALAFKSHGMGHPADGDMIARLLNDHEMLLISFINLAEILSALLFVLMRWTEVALALLAFFFSITLEEFLLLFLLANVLVLINCDVKETWQ